MSKKIFLGENVLQQLSQNVTGQFVEIENESFYKIANVNRMPDFFMTIVSDSNHWMYLSSNGSLTAGRKNRDNALFPYYTDDKIHDYKNKTGSKTYCIVNKNERLFWWEPFTDESEKVYKTERNLYKSIYGNKIIFEEINHDLGVAFRYGWYNSDKYGWIKKSLLTNISGETRTVEIVDGIQNILPYGVYFTFQNEYSNLIDAYKKNELLSESRLGLFMLSSIPVDRAEPSEALKTTTVWSVGGNPSTEILLSDKQITNFKNGRGVQTEIDIRAKRGAYYLCNSYQLNPNETRQWLFAADLSKDSADVANLDNWLCTEKNIAGLVDEDIRRGTEKLKKIVAAADGLQAGNEQLVCARHFSNTLFNVMRGGIFVNNYTIDVNDFKIYLNQINKKLAEQFSAKLAHFEKYIKYTELLDWARQQKNIDIERISYEYLPLTFSRRHGDPSRPWNVFSIDTKNPDGSEKLHYQGNWRDIFQNWEALGFSYPGFIDGMICKFLNASTADGYNPYRITRDGIDWEVPNPEEPWSFIGYWGDHQIIYLQKLLELSNSYFPGKLDEYLTREIFVYANVPYRIKTFEQILNNPKNTIDFDYELNEKLEASAKNLGADGKLITHNNTLYHANLTEKILVTLLAKLSNFIPEAGIWLNTQRPEWNDANNALVGNGVSMVTLYYIRRFLTFWKEKFENASVKKIHVSEEIKSLFDAVNLIFTSNKALLKTGFSDSDRYEITFGLGIAGDTYRRKIYAQSFAQNKTSIAANEIVYFIETALLYLDQSIQKNKREDGLYHAYNLISIKENSISIRYLYEMLEGQVAVLSSGLLNASESLAVLDALKSSSMFRKDQYSYILYPDRQLPLFTEKNRVPADFVKSSVLLQKLLAGNANPLVKQDKKGNVYFNGNFRNANDLAEAIEKLSGPEISDLVGREKEAVLGIYEKMFDHQSFTGRSGTFYGYEGLGSIYWHMVSKLLLAVQECFFKGVNEKADNEILGRLKAHYYEIKAGIGLYKSPELYGAFPTDAYSHTPGGAGVKQPGLTGQVKEDVISRFGELGILVKDGQIIFETALFNYNEILDHQETFSYFDLKGNQKNINLDKNQVAFTFCQTLVVLSFNSNETLRVFGFDGSVQEFQGNVIDKITSSKLFERTGEIERIEVSVTNKN